MIASLKSVTPRRFEREDSDEGFVYTGKYQKPQTSVLVSEIYDDTKLEERYS